HAASAVESAGRVGRRTRENLHSPPPAIRRIGVGDLGHVLARGYDDFAAFRTDVIFLCVFYPLVGLVLARLAFGYDLLPLIFPLASGFALVGPLAAIGLGVGIGFLFALLVLAISVISFPLLLDREVGVDTAVLTSNRAVFTNPGPMTAWGLIVAGGLVIASIPFFLGLIIVMPVLGHATWHIYRLIVSR